MNKLIIRGTAVKEGISRNKRKYISKELKKFTPTLIGRPILKDHEGKTDNVIGKVTGAEFVDNENKVIYEGWIKEDNSGIIDKIKDGRISEVSIGALAGKIVKENKDDDIIIPVDMEAMELSTTPVPGNKGTSIEFENVKLDESTIKQMIKDYEKEVQMTEDYETEAKVTAMEAKRKQLGMSVSQFYAAPRDPPSSSALPIFDAAHTRNAMARFNQTHFKSSSEKATAKAKILRAARKFGIDVSNFGESQSLDNQNIIKKEDRCMETTTENTVSDDNVEVELKSLKEQIASLKETNDSLKKEKDELLEAKRLGEIERYKKLCEKKGVSPNDLSKATDEMIQFAIKLVEDLPDADEPVAEEPTKEEPAAEEPAADEKPAEEEKPVAEPESQEPEEKESENFDGYVITTEDVAGRGVALYKYY